MEWEQFGVARYYSHSHCVAEFYPGEAMSGQTARGWGAYRRNLGRSDVHLGDFATMDEAMAACLRDTHGLQPSPK